MAQESNQVTTTELRAQIEHTRAEMEHTIDRIQSRLSPSRIVADAKDSVRDATVGRVKRLAAKANGQARVLETIKANPLPFAIAGVVAAALATRAMLRSRNRARRTRPRGPEASAEQGRVRSNRFAGNGGRFLVGACTGSLAGWSAWRANRAAVYGENTTVTPTLPPPQD